MSLFWLFAWGKFGDNLKIRKMERKHTKGPWIAEDIQVSANPEIEGNIVCEAPELWPESYKYWEANARLIAAAPDTLEVLETIENDNNQVPEWLWLRIKEVIKKATKNV